MLSPSFWEDQKGAQKIIDETNDLKSWLEPYYELKKRFDDVQSLAADSTIWSDVAFVEEIDREVQVLEKELESLELKKMLSGQLDKNNCFLSINAGAGGTEACDWAAMLLRMYTRWAAERGWKVEVVDALEGEVAGIRNATIRLIGSYAYGWSKAEKGVHRLVRISPFDSNARRHTSFAAVDVTPEISDEVTVEIRPEDLRVDTYRSSGAGGQHVNKTDSAVRMTHLPTGIIVSSQQQRSQQQNREACMKMLRSKLYELEMEKRLKTIQSLGGVKMEIGWGSQIRSYTFQPYTLVKDHRTGVEIGNVGAVMDGQIDDFIYAFLKEFGGA
jgi:peptide chain release factor 2